MIRRVSVAVLDLNLGSGRLPFLHLRCGDIDTLRLAAATHGEVDIERGEAKTLVTLGDDVEGSGMVEDVVVERELAAVSQNLDQFRDLYIDYSLNSPGDEIHTLGLDGGPAGLLDLGSDLGELIGRNLASPVGLDGLLNLTVGTCDPM